MRTAPLSPPTSGALTIYIGGPGYGECQVVIFPDGRCMVVDTCESRGVHYPLALLERLGISKVDLLVVTHSDLDHCGGVPALLRSVEVEDVWRYPAGNLPEVLAAALRAVDDRRLRRLGEAMDALASVNAARVQEVDIGNDTWPYHPGPYQVRCIAPCQGDKLAARADLRAMVAWYGAGRPGLEPRLEAYLDGSRRDKPGVHGNVLSVALAIDWCGHRILLGGDVEAPESADRGWNGIHECLLRRGRLGCLTDLTFVKVAHHGSRGAWNDRIWNLHTQSAPVPAVALTPYRRGRVSSRPPHADVLANLRTRADLLGLTAKPDPRVDWAQVSRHGWRVRNHARASLAGHWLAATFNSEGRLELGADFHARWFEQR